MLNRHLHRAADQLLAHARAWPLWQAAYGVRAEQAAALRNARLSTGAAIADLPSGAAGSTGLRLLVGAFDGSRHLEASIIGQNGGVLAASQPAPAPATPAWLLKLIAPTMKPVVLPVKGQSDIASIRVASAPLNEAAERWAELRARVLGFGCFFAQAATLCSLTAARSLRPLTLLALGMIRVGRGETAPALPEAGPRETATLARSFNDMAAALRAAQTQNRRLERQIVTIAEEERAEIARGLHDEVGPLLFAITTFTAAIGRQVQSNNLAPVFGQVAAIQETVARLQLQVRDLLGRLVQADTSTADLEAAVLELTAFWRGIRPELLFCVSMATGAQFLSEASRECLFRAAQEGISNAVRHGNPRTITISAMCRDGWAVLSVADDGSGGPENSGLGLAGMRARAAALGGRVAIERGAGWTVTVNVPVAAHTPHHLTCDLDQGANA